MEKGPIQQNRRCRMQAGIVNLGAIKIFAQMGRQEIKTQIGKVVSR